LKSLVYFFLSLFFEIAYGAAHISLLTDPRLCICICSKLILLSQRILCLLLLANSPPLSKRWEKANLTRIMSGRYMKKGVTQLLPSYQRTFFKGGR